MNQLAEVIILKLICLIMQQKQTKNISHIHTSSFALKSNLASLKIEVDKLDIDKLKLLTTNLDNLEMKVDKLDFDKLAPAPAGLSKLSNAVKNGIVKKAEYNARIKDIEDKIPDFFLYTI